MGGAGFPLSSESGTCKTDKARFSPWFQGENARRWALPGRRSCRAAGAAAGASARGVHYLSLAASPPAEEARYKAPWKRVCQLSWRKAGPLTSSR